MEWTEILITFLTLVFTVVIAPAVAFYFKSKAKSELAHTFISDVERAASDAVNIIGQTFVNDLKKKNADGKLTDDEKSEALFSAVSLAESMLSKATKEYMAKNGLEIGQFLESLIESQIGSMKRYG
jgi:hypothetical protein